MSKIVIHDGDREIAIGLRGQYAHIRSERKLREVVKRSLDGMRARGGAWAAYADALERKPLLAQLCELGMVSN